MKAYEHLRAKAVELRTERDMALGEICERLGLGKSTVYYWIKDIPFSGKRKSPKYTAARLRASHRTSEKYRKLREQAYEAARESAEKDLQDSRLRDFVILYMAEGYKRSRNNVVLGNSDPAIVKLAYEQITLRTERKLNYQLQLHVDNDEQELRGFWASMLGIQPELIKIQRKSNSGAMSGRQWRSVHGVFSVRVGDTYLRARLQAWMDFLSAEWTQNISNSSVNADQNAV